MVNNQTKGTLLQIAQLGVPLLREKSQVVEKIKGREVQKLIADMIATVHEVDGVGIAAPQVYQSLRVFIIASHPSPRYPKAPRVRPFAVINPVILEKSSEKEKGWEGCLSIPGIRGLVPRHSTLKIKYFTRAGKEREQELQGFLARIFQHEYDHLEGEVFIDRLETTKDVITEKEYQRMFRKKRK
jgi:peptide deformylase